MIQLLADAIGPILAHDPQWVQPMLIAVGALFVLALFVGPLMLARSPRETRPPHTTEPGVREDSPHPSNH